MLSKRHGSTLTRRSILKGYYHSGGAQRKGPAVEGISDLRAARGMAVYTIGGSTVQVRAACSMHLAPRRRQ